MLVNIFLLMGAISVADRFEGREGGLLISTFQSAVDSSSYRANFDCGESFRGLYWPFIQRSLLGRLP
jgi:hypothetical protein